MSLSRNRKARPITSVNWGQYIMNAQALTTDAYPLRWVEKIHTNMRDKNKYFKIIAEMAEEHYGWNARHLECRWIDDPRTVEGSALGCSFREAKGFSDIMNQRSFPGGMH